MVQALIGFTVEVIFRIIFVSMAEKEKGALSVGRPLSELLWRKGVPIFVQIVKSKRLMRGEGKFLMELLSYTMRKVR